MGDSLSPNSRCRTRELTRAPPETDLAKFAPRLRLLCATVGKRLETYVLLRFLSSVHCSTFLPFQKVEFHVKRLPGEVDEPTDLTRPPAAWRSRWEAPLSTVILLINNIVTTTIAIRRKWPRSRFPAHCDTFLFVKVFCDMTSDNKGWTLVARFSNNDAKNWMKDNGEYWYDRRSAVGQTTNPTHNADMISPAFWSVKGTEFKITRSDDSSHTALLQTTSNCLSGQTFRSKLTSYGDFRNGNVWASDQCLGSCDVQYGGQYSNTDGFQQAQCDGNIQTRKKVGFWCDWSTGDGAVMMIGGGGSSCGRADHGIGITETNAASFVEDGGGATEFDFGFNAETRYAPSSSYALNLWVR